MAFDAKLATRIRKVLADRRDVEEKAMFGGLAFMVRGHMSCGIVKEKLMVRIEPESYDRLLAEPNVKPMDFSGKAMRGFLYVEPGGIATARSLRKWVERVLKFAESRPQKTTKSKR
jgi:TfoX/Sxy family transcriptional regulator of competence genes